MRFFCLDVQTLDEFLQQIVLKGTSHGPFLARVFTMIFMKYFFICGFICAGIAARADSLTRVDMAPANDFQKPVFTLSPANHDDLKTKLSQKIKFDPSLSASGLDTIVHNGLVIVLSDEIVDGNVSNKENEINQAPDRTVLNPQYNHRESSFGPVTFYFNQRRVTNANGWVETSGTDLATAFTLQKFFKQRAGPDVGPTGDYSDMAYMADFIVSLAAAQTVDSVKQFILDNGGTVLGSARLGKATVFILDPFEFANKAMTRQIQGSRYAKVFSSAEVGLVRQDLSSQHFDQSDVNSWIYKDSAIGLEFTLKLAP